MLYKAHQLVHHLNEMITVNLNSTCINEVKEYEVLVKVCKYNLTRLENLINLKYI